MLKTAIKRRIKTTIERESNEYRINSAPHSITIGFRFEFFWMKCRSECHQFYRMKRNEIEHKMQDKMQTALKWFSLWKLWTIQTMQLKCRFTIVDHIKRINQRYKSVEMKISTESVIISCEREFNNLVEAGRECDSIIMFNALGMCSTCLVCRGNLKIFVKRPISLSRTVMNQKLRSPLKKISLRIFCENKRKKKRMKRRKKKIDFRFLAKVNEWKMKKMPPPQRTLKASIMSIFVFLFTLQTVLHRFFQAV